MCEEEKRRSKEPFMLPGEVTWAEWHQSFSLDEKYKFETPTAKTIPAQNNNLKFFLSATRFSWVPTLQGLILTLEYTNMESMEEKTKYVHLHI